MQKPEYKFTNKEGSVLGRGTTIDIKDVWKKGVGLARQFNKPIELRLSHSEDERMELIGEYHPDLTFHDTFGCIEQFDINGNKIRK